MARISDMIKKEDLRPVEINGHDFYGTGFFHRYMDKNGKAYALIEHRSGVLEYYDLMLYQIKFLDRE